MIEKENQERALMRAQSQAVELPVLAQIMFSEGFIEWEKKRLVAAKEAVIAVFETSAPKFLETPQMCFSRPQLPSGTHHARRLSI